MKCPVCKGKRTYEDYYYGIQNCKYCGGTGKVPIHKWFYNLIWVHIPKWVINILYNIEMNKHERK